MNAMPDSFVVNSCQYTPVYLIQDSGASQVQSFFIAQSNVEEPLQVTDNLKAFYESSGNIENTFVNVNGSVGSPKPRILKKPDAGAVGNNLKLASFLQPKNDSLKQQYLMNSMILKPNTTVTNPSSTITSTTYATANNTRLNIDSKIVKLKDVALKTRYNRIERVPKINKPKDVAPATIPVSPNITVSVPTVPICVPTVQVPLNIPSVPSPVLTAPVNTMPAPNTSLPSKHTSVQLLKLGETYHSLNQLSDEQMKMVTQALKIFSNPEKNDPEPTYDPVTNTKFIYKVVSPKELTVVGNNKTIVPLKSYTEACEKRKIERILSKELKKEAVRETLRKNYLAKDVKKEVPEFLVPKESIFKFESKKEFIAKQQNLLKGELKKESKKTKPDPSETEGLLKTEPLKEGIFKGESNKEGVLKGESKKEGLHKVELNKEGTVEPKKEGAFKVESKREGVSKVENKKHNILKNESLKKEASLKKAHEKFVKQMEKEMLEEQEAKETEKVTRSGRKVKLPKPILPLDTPHKPKKKNVIIPCFQCAEEFNSLYRLQKHYENHPTHIPSKIHSNLFHCLLAIVNGGSEEDRTNIFIQQLEQLVVKLRSLLPCLLSTSETGRTCHVSEDVGNLLGVFPGRYSIDIDALECVKTTEGLCRHKRAPTPTYKEDLAQNWTTIEEDFSTPEVETDDCARINSVEKWPTVNKRVWKQKQKKNAKRMRLASENNDALIELGIDDFVMLANPPACSEGSAINTPVNTEIKADIKECDGFSETNSMSLPDSESLNLPQNPEQTEFRHPDPTSLLETDSQSANLEQIASAIAILEKETNPTNHLQFHSAHFDIRSSPIKPTSTVFRKFQISPELLAKCETRSIRSIETVDKDHEALKSDERNSLNGIGEHLSEIPDDLNEIPGNLNEISQNFNGMPHNLDAIQENLNSIPENLDGISSNLSKIARSLNEIPPISNGITNNLKESLSESTDATHCQISNEQNNEDSTDAITTDETLRLIFREEDLSKESFTLDRELKDWILNRSSNEEKSEDGFDKPNTLIEPSLIHVKDHEIKTVCDVIEQKGLPSDNHDDSSVLHFLDTLGNACLSYPGTEIRTNGDFQLDLFSFHSTQ